MSKPINVYSIPELRQALDEALPGNFSRLNYQQSYGLIDSKLFIGYSIAAVAAISFLLDKKFAYREVVQYQALLVGAYMVLSVVFWYHSKFVEKGIKYVGVDKKGGKLFVKTSFENGKPEYLVELSNDKGVELKTSLSARKVFTEAGYLQNNLLFQWLEDQVRLLDSKKTQ